MADTKRLSEAEIQERLADLPHWTLDNGQLFREIKFKDFIHAFGFMTSVALIAQAMDHHPDWTNVYNTVSIRLSSHDVKGLSGRDFALARKINEIAGP